ncbi:MAG: hypothetical protein QNJ19_03180 [Woeseiaceae bacterium]|nr:hypothetical protein [Woeseiaceae bacterium]
MSESEKVPVSFWVIAGAALVWNLFGLLAYYLRVTATPEMLAEMYTTEAELAFMTSLPAWATGAQGLAVTAGVLGCLLLLVRKKVAKMLFIASLAGVLAQNAYGFILGDGLETFGPGALVLPIVVIVVAIALVIFSAKAAEKGWLK